MGIGTTVFDAFPFAIEQGWQIAQMAYSTVLGNDVDGDTAINIDVIVDEGSNTDPNPSPSAQSIRSDTLLYVRPNQLPTLDTATLTADYSMLDPNGKVYAIIDAGIGKNQETGVIEHVELKIRQIGEA